MVTIHLLDVGAPQGVTPSRLRPSVWPAVSHSRLHTETSAGFGAWAINLPAKSRRSGRTVLVPRGEPRATANGTSKATFVCFGQSFETPSRARTFGYRGLSPSTAAWVRCGRSPSTILHVPPESNQTDRDRSEAPGRPGSLMLCGESPTHVRRSENRVVFDTDSAAFASEEVTAEVSGRKPVRHSPGPPQGVRPASLPNHSSSRAFVASLPRTIVVESTLNACFLIALAGACFEAWERSSPWVRPFESLAAP